MFRSHSLVPMRVILLEVGTLQSNQIKMRSFVFLAQLCLMFCNLMDCSLPGFPVHEILQAGILEWVAISFSRGSS